MKYFWNFICSTVSPLLTAVCWKWQACFGHVWTVTRTDIGSLNGWSSTCRRVSRIGTAVWALRRHTNSQPQSFALIVHQGCTLAILSKLKLLSKLVCATSPGRNLRKVTTLRSLFFLCVFCVRIQKKHLSKTLYPWMSLALIYFLAWATVGAALRAAMVERQETAKLSLSAVFKQIVGSLWLWLLFL